MTWVLLSNVVPRAVDYAADVGMIAAIAYVVVLVALVLSPLDRRSETSEAGLGRERRLVLK